MHQQDVERTGSPLSVCLAPTAGWPIADSLAMLRRIGVHRFGVPATTLESQGWDIPLAAITASGMSAEFIMSGVRASQDDDSGWDAALTTLRRAIDGAVEVGATAVSFTSGGSGALTWEDAAQRAVTRFAPLVAHARDKGVALALENTMSIRSGISFTHSVADIAELAHRLGVGLMVDLYSAWQERGLMQTITDNLDAVRIVQIGDHRTSATSVPNRWVPGDGEMPLERMVREVRELGYRGVIDLELLGPAIDDEGPERALERGWEWMRTHVP